MTTKTTGPGKRVQEAPFFVQREVPLTGHDWVQQGFEAWGAAFKRTGGKFFLMDCNESFGDFVE